MRKEGGGGYKVRKRGVSEQSVCKDLGKRERPSCDMEQLLESFATKKRVLTDHNQKTTDQNIMLH